VAAVIFALVLGVVLFRPRKVDLAFSAHQMARAQQDVATAKLFEGGECADEGGYEHYLELARAPVVGEETLSCLVKLQQPGLVDAYLGTLKFDDPDRLVSQRNRRLAIAFTAALGERATSELCHVADGRAGEMGGGPRASRGGNPAADTCIIDNLQSGIPPCYRRAACASSSVRNVSPRRRGRSRGRCARCRSPGAGGAIPRWRCSTRTHRHPDRNGREGWGPAVAAVAQARRGATPQDYRFMHPDSTTDRGSTMTFNPAGHGEGRGGPDLPSGKRA
jgi:hypothetical protein